MSIQNILERQKVDLITIRPEDTIETAAKILTTHNIGAIPVRDSEAKMVGVLSERDLVRGFATKGSSVMSLAVADLMTSKVTSCRSEDSVKDAMKKMSKLHIRHLPVIDDDGGVIGMISLRDVMELRLEQSEMEASELRAYAIASGGAL
ncbi:MAG: CBS domain-containing protein [Rhodospirillaceae bacterium]|jgi:CBS domain-containing protein|nr:CBS domain-containing protein [Rhodospirillaceae bacterium]MBT4219238.1 CBS domain-containing protein [Rhodospirillaceae bacterium]MBT4463154.1 CBS domain-containing protein [Rhodospirillaceae bacterium]MBT5014411.1 CBS domain-containing protein [Rhodospirillaceae bacterium]MBT5309688.1 CBS domain-containing protein [Rhodospirillaceae bacterium]